MLEFILILYLTSVGLLIEVFRCNRSRRRCCEKDNEAQKLVLFRYIRIMNVICKMDYTIPIKHDGRGG